MFKKSSKKKSAVSTTVTMAQVDSFLITVLTVIATLASLAALIGVYKAHFLSAGVTFGTLNGSASLVALAFTLTLLKKLWCSCMGLCDKPTKK